MNMTLSKRGDYVVRSALSLGRAYDSGSYRKIREVVAEMAVPQTFASQILSELVRAGLAVSRAGKDGGYRLSRNPSEITLLEVVEAGEGPLRSERCALGDGPCRWEAVCPLHETWGAATAALRTTLSATNLSWLVERDIALERGAYLPPTDSHRHGSPLLAIEDRVSVPVPPDYVRARFEDPEKWLSRSVRAACDEAERLRQELEGSTLSSEERKIRTIASTTCTPLESDPASFSLIWDVSAPGGIASRFEGTLVILSGGEGESEIRIQGHYRPHTKAEDGAAEIAEKIARASVRLTLRQVALHIETAWAAGAS